ncbi:MAG: hypothetical protein AABM43_12140 [Actinomycetota bacterium]
MATDGQPKLGKIRLPWGGDRTPEGAEKISIPQDQDRAAAHPPAQTTRHTYADGRPVPERFDLRGRLEDAGMSLDTLSKRANLPLALCEKLAAGQEPTEGHALQLDIALAQAEGRE